MVVGFYSTNMWWQVQAVWVTELLNQLIHSEQNLSNWIIWTRHQLHCNKQLSWELFVPCVWSKTFVKQLGITTLEIRVFSYISAKNVHIHTNHCSFQLKWTLEAVKLPLLFLFTQSMIRRSTVLINKLIFSFLLEEYYLWIQNNILQLLKTELFES